MKRAFIVMASALCASAIFAAGIENKTNLSTGFARNPSRNVENSRPEAAFYNIAGTAFLADGLYAEIGDQVVLKKYTNDWDGIPGVVPGGDTSDTTTVFLYPDVDIVFKRNNFSVFGTFGIYAGGGSLNYDDGTSITSALFAKTASTYKGQAVQAQAAAQAAGTAGQAAQAQAYGKAAQQAAGAAQAFLGAALDHELKIKSITYGGQVGAAFKPIDMLSVAAAIRFTYGTQSMKLKSSSLVALGGSNKVEYEASAFAVAPVLGVHLRPIEILDFSLQWQGCSYMNYNIDKVKGNKTIAAGLGVEEDKKFRTDIPMALNVGAGVRVIEPLYLNAGFTYYFNSEANTKMNNALGKTDYDDSFEISLGADYTINKQWGVSAGLCYGNQGQSSDANSVFSPVLDSLTVGCGVEFKPIEPLTLTLAGMYSFYFDEDYDLAPGGPEATLSKKLGIISLGATYKFF